MFATRHTVTWHTLSSSKINHHTGAAAALRPPPRPFLGVVRLPSARLPSGTAGSAASGGDGAPPPTTWAKRQASPFLQPPALEKYLHGFADDGGDGAAAAGGDGPGEAAAAAAGGDAAIANPRIVVGGDGDAASTDARAALVRSSSF